MEVLKMAEELDAREVLSIEEALRMEIFISQALVDILVAKGIVTHGEIMQRITELRASSKLVLAQSRSNSIHN